MFSLRRRRLRGNMIKVFKRIQGIDKVNLGKLFCIGEDKRKENIDCLKIRSHINSNIRLKFYTSRIISYWNHLTDEVVSCKSLSIFKIRLNEFMAAKEEI